MVLGDKDLTYQKLHDMLTELGFSGFSEYAAMLNKVPQRDEEDTHLYNEWKRRDKTRAGLQALIDRGDPHA